MGPRLRVLALVAGLGIVLVGDGRAKERQDAGAGDVLDVASEALDLSHHSPNRIADDQPDLFGVQLLA
jgi:hypothetical protein